MTKIYILLIISSVTASFGQVFFKLAKGNIFNPFVVVGLLMYAISTLLWIYALKYLPLSKVYPFTFLTFGLVLLLSYLIFNERLNLLNMLGVILILIGVYLSVK